MVDKIRPLKFERPSAGTQNNRRFTAETNPNEDYVSGKGFSFQLSDNFLIDVDTNGYIKFKDSDQTSFRTFKNLIDQLKQLKSGIVANTAFTGSPDKKATVTFSTPYPNTNYSIEIVGVDIRSWTYESKTVNGFVINSNANQALTGEVSWVTRSVGEGS